MVAFTNLIALAAAATAVSALKSPFEFDLKFTRYLDGSCEQSFKTVKLEEHQCRTFSPGEVSTSFSYKPNRRWSDDKRYGCQVTVYYEDRCAGEGFTLGDAAQTFGQCGMFSEGIRSVQATCDGQTKTEYMGYKEKPGKSGH